MAYPSRIKDRNSSLASCSLQTWAVLVITAALFFFQVTTAGSCTANQRRAWTNLTDTEKRAYIDAELCLQSLPSTLTGVSGGGTQSLFDDLQWSHLAQVSYIHHVGAFLPWHRYFVTVHERLLQEQCHFAGAQPYWPELADQARPWPDLAVFAPDTGFGGNGVLDNDNDGNNNCVQDGPFAHLTLHLAVNGSTTEYCLSRDFNQTNFAQGNQANLDACYTGAQSANFSAAWPCYELNPHSAGHGTVKGVMVNVSLSPGDPLFYLHHAYLDMRYWQWQQLHPSVRLFEVGGPNVAWTVATIPQLFPQAAFTEYNGDPPGNVTTLNHTLWVAGLKPNVTIADVMDITDDTVCAEYVE